MSIVVPTIRGYKPFYISTANPQWVTDHYEYVAYRSDDSGGLKMVAQSQPFPLEYKLKEPYKNEWPDKDGDEEFSPGNSESYHLEAFELTIKFYVKAVDEREAGDEDEPSPAHEVTTAVRVFFNSLSQRKIAIYDSWQGIGFSDVRFVSGNVEERRISEVSFGNGSAWAIVAVTFKVNNPRAILTSCVYDEDHEYYILS